MRSRVLKSLPVSLIFYIQWIIVWHSSVLTGGVKCGDLLPIPFRGQKWNTGARNGHIVRTRNGHHHEPEMDASRVLRNGLRPTYHSITSKPYVGRMIVIHAIKLCDSLESVTTSTVFINCIEITSTVQTLRSKTLQVLWTDANYSSVHKYSFEFWTLQPFRNGKNRQEQFICSHEFWTLQTFKVTKKSQKQFKWSGL